MYIADLHIHSKYSRATSRDLTPEYLDLWARRKGIGLVGTGDFTHPAWREELQEKLAPAEGGLYVLKNEFRIKDGTADEAVTPRFVITGEISSIYKKNDKVRKVHSVIVLPGLSEAKLLARRLEAVGNLHSDGRPILGLDCRDLLEITLEMNRESIYIPAHIWTPHFSVLGAFSGFDSLEECYEDLTPCIHALETGLSSDPPMNWRLSALDGYQLISNSDAHSPSKLGREGNLIDGELSFEGLSKAIQTGDGLAGTIEFFPEEGKYHFDGHRKCRLCLSPAEAETYSGRCPVCGRKLTIGVSHRVEQLADRKEGFILPAARPFESLVPLPEVIGASIGHSAAGVRVQRLYLEMLAALGSEFSILRELPIEEIKRTSGYFVAEGIRRLREGQVERRPGYDGEYGIIRLFHPMELSSLDGQFCLFTGEQMEELSKRETAAAQVDTAGGDFKAGSDGEVGFGNGIDHVAGTGEGVFADCNGSNTAGVLANGISEKETEFDPGQEAAMKAAARTVAVIAGPGTGKTRTLVAHALYLVKERGVRPSEMTAVTFTNQAAKEMRERLESGLGGKRQLSRMRIGTFHSICYNLLKKAGTDFVLADEFEMKDTAEEIMKEMGLKLSARQFLRQISARKTDFGWESKQPGGERPKAGQSESEQPGVKGLESGKREMEPEQITAAAYDAYQKKLEELGALDFDDLLLQGLRLFETTKKDKTLRLGFSYLLVDEFQDISPIQYRLIREWNRTGRELFVIGDPDQAIYSFRGSDSQCFEYLQREDPFMKEVYLGRNYRSTPQILKAAGGVISRNGGRERKQMPYKKDGVLVRLVTASGEMAEDIFIAKEINRFIGGIDMLDAQGRIESGEEQKGRSFSDIAVLYRTNRQARLLETCLQKEGIPYVVTGREDFLMEQKVRGTVCFFRFLQDGADEAARHAGVRLLWGEAKPDEQQALFQAMADIYLPGFRKEKPRKLLESWVCDMKLKDGEGLEKLIAMSVFYKSMGEFLESLAFGRESDLKRSGKRDYTSDAVTLTTLHASKGLEFPVVLIGGARNGVLPLENGKQECDAEEERRLCYVGMTRAKEELVFVTSREPSVFLEDIPETVLLKENVVRQKENNEGKQMNLFDFM